MSLLGSIGIRSMLDRLKFWEQNVSYSCVRSFELKTNVFEKLLNSYSCILFMKLFGLSVFCIKLLLFFKISVFQNFNRSNVFFDQSKISRFFKSRFCLSRLILNRSKLKKFQFLSFWPNIFHALFMFKIHMPCIVFCINLAVLHLYLLLFSHITCIHFANWVLNLI